MAREESSREDLLREATALVERIEILPHTSSSHATNTLNVGHVVAGFRRDGALSIFFGDDPVYQFNAGGELRRAYCNGKLLKATRGRLVALERVRTEHEVQLVRHELSDAEEAALLTQMVNLLRDFAALANAGVFEVAGQVPPDADLLGRLKQWFLTHDEVQIAQQPNV
jgi:hypothetical protein